MKYRKRAFTLVELLVVIAIIGILSTIIIVSYGNLQAKSRDSKRKADLQSIASALSIYYADKKLYIKSDYQVAVDLNYSLDDTTIACPTETTTTPVSNEMRIRCLKDYLTSTPQDPKYIPKSNFHYYYIGNANSTGYKITSDPRIADSSDNALDSFEASGNDAAGCGTKAGEFADPATWSISGATIADSVCSHFQVSSSTIMRNTAVTSIYPKDIK